MVVNVITLIIYIPGLSCAPKPVHKVGLPPRAFQFCKLKVSRQSLGGPWDPLFYSAGYEHGIFPNTIEALKNVFGVAKDKILANDCPQSWLFYSWAIGLWFYQSLDSIDGKQARRTGTSGPLGEMFDHGCDAINTTLEVLLCAAAMNLGQSWWTVASQVATLANFYLTTWEEYHTGVRPLPLLHCCKRRKLRAR